MADASYNDGSDDFSALLDGATLAGLHAGLREAEGAADTRVEVLSPEHQDLLGRSAPMRELAAMIDKVAPTRAAVLIVGESGTGKEVVANTIHRHSKQRDKQFLAVNCGAIPPTLIEAELFGYERGSFTGAVRSHKGLFERAADGTLFLDEITEMPTEMQVKLLRVLETGCFYRVGGDQVIQASGRVIAATNRRPDDAVAEGSLRADLLYRLAVFPLYLPALRERGEDIDLLADMFLRRMNAEEGTAKVLSAESRAFLRSHDWPGNVRELKNAMQRAFILAGDELDLPASIPRPMPGPEHGGAECITVELGSSLAEAERSLIHATLELCDGNKRHAAKILGVSLKTLYNRLNEYSATVGGGRTRSGVVANA